MAIPVKAKNALKTGIAICNNEDVGAGVSSGLLLFILYHVEVYEEANGDKYSFNTKRKW